MSNSAVAPYTGAWIEITLPKEVIQSLLVAPYTGAWIEILLECNRSSQTLVAPYTGAWIEIDNKFLVSIRIRSHPTRVRGLKFVLEPNFP